MSSITVKELKDILDGIDDEYEVIMNIKHKHDISKEDGIKGWITYINGIHVDDAFKEIRLMN